MDERLTAALGRRAVACKSWRWLPGMRTADGWRLLSVSPGHHAGRYLLSSESAEAEHTDYEGDSERTWGINSTPDLSDPATLGCLLALVRGAWKDQSAHVMPYSGDPDHSWRVWFETDHSRTFDGDTEAEALVATLEAAPGK